MNKFIMEVNHFINDEDGLTVLEYVIGAGLLVLGLTVVFTGYGQTLQDKLTDILNSITTP
jgi:pilus assembly protein Flp/PilA